MTAQFCQMTYLIMAATHWISAHTGEKISFTGDQKIMWVWMFQRFEHFKSKGREWFDNQADIVAATGTSESTVKRFMALLKTHGYITVETRRRQGFIQSNSYTILSDLVLWSPASECKSASVSTPVPVPTLDEPEERIPDYAPIVFTAPAPKVSLTPGPVVREVAPVVPKVNLPCDIPTGNDPVWEVRRSS